MSEGFVPAEQSSRRTVSSWVQGAPRKSLWLGLKFSTKPIQIRTSRCNRCGFLESYAPG
ncbi:hypothetical protein [Sphingomonas sp.]|jgi:hypothetical protein|uniref:hypothetical protein n=1 Tax=Sphingomonas sp. TaxID=28214 RepID=UPI002EDAD464